MSKKLFIFVLVFTFAFRIWQTTGCQQFLGHTFLPLSIKIRVEEQVGNDKNLPRNVSRAFHNKASEGFFEISKSYATFFNIQLLLSILGPAGLSLLIFSLLKIKDGKNLYRLHLLIFLLVPLLLLIKINSALAFYTFAASLYSFSIWGLDFFLKSKARTVLFLLLIVFTFFYFSYNWQMPQICNEIFFN